MLRNSTNRYIPNLIFSLLLYTYYGRNCFRIVIRNCEGEGGILKIVSNNNIHVCRHTLNGSSVTMRRPVRLRTKLSERLYKREYLIICKNAYNIIRYIIVGMWVILETYAAASDQNVQRNQVLCVRVYM